VSESVLQIAVDETSEWADLATIASLLGVADVSAFALGAGSNLGAGAHAAGANRLAGSSAPAPILSTRCSTLTTQKPRCFAI